MRVDEDFSDRVPKLCPVARLYVCVAFQCGFGYGVRDICFIDFGGRFASHRRCLHYKRRDTRPN